MSPSTPPTANDHQVTCLGKGPRCCAGVCMKPVRLTPASAPPTTTTTRKPTYRRQTCRPVRGPQDRSAGLPHPDRPRRRRAHQHLINRPGTTTTGIGDGSDQGATINRWGNNRGQLPQHAVSRTRLAALQEASDGLKSMSGRITRRAGHPINHHVAGPQPADLGKPGWPCRHFIDRHRRVSPNT
jgi:hypothetical protein